MVTAEENRWQPSGASPAPVLAHDAGETGLLDIWALVRRRKWVLLFGVVMGLGLAALYYYQATPIYESSVEILVMQKDSNLPARAEGDGYSDRGNYGDLLATHIQIFQSPRVVRRAIEQHRLERLPTFRERAALSEGFDPVRMVVSNLQVRSGGEGQARDARVLRAAYRGTSPQDCAAVLAALVESYQHFLGETFQDTSMEAVSLITRAKDELEVEVQEGQESYLRFRDSAPLLDRGSDRGGSSLQQAHLLQLQKSLTEVRIQKSETEARLEILLQAEDADATVGELAQLALLGAKDAERVARMLNIARGGPASEAFLALQPIRSVTASMEFDRYLSLVLKRQELLMDFGPDYPDVAKVDEQIAAIEQFLQTRSVPEAREQPTFTTAELVATLIQSLHNDLRDLERRERDLERLLAQEREAARQLVAYELRNEMLRDTITRKSDLYQAVVARLAEISLIKDYGGYVTEMISPVEQPTRAVAPRRTLVLALGMMLGLFSGSGLAWLIEISDRTFRSPEEIRQALGSPIVAHLPILTPVSRKRVQPQTNGQAVDLTVASYHRPKSRQAEAIRGLRTSLFFKTRASDMRVIHVTSPQPRDGKTTTVANLAVAMAQSGKRVLLIDADMRNSRIHKVFGLENQQGLSNVLVDEVEPADAIQQIDQENLWIMPSGPHPPNPSELLTLPTFEQLLRMLRQQYDYVLIDSPPMLAVSDPAVIAPIADGVLLVIRVLKNGSPAAIQARNLLAGVGANVIGVSINDVNRSPYYGYSYYGSRYSYGNRYGYSYGNGYAYGYGYGYGYGNEHSEYYEKESEAETAK